MAMFQFELVPIEEVRWGGAEPSWFSLTEGIFSLRAGDQVLFEYSDEILRHWRTGDRYPRYQIASFARDMLACFAPGVAPLPQRIERFASDWESVTRLRATSQEDEDEELWYTAWRWLGERSPWTSYLIAYPPITFVRIHDDVIVHWDNRDRLVDGIPVWTAQHGQHVLAVDLFRAECRDFADRLLRDMRSRIGDDPSLVRQHEKWRSEFTSCFNERAPGIPWPETEEALETIAVRHRARFRFDACPARR